MARVDIEFTGERLVPGKTNPDVHKEHIDRYMFAAGMAAGKTVLDVACGTGYGAGLMAEGGAAVTGVDMSLEAVRYARDWFGDNGCVTFVCADAVHLPFPDRSFQVVISFETLEHIRAYRQFLAECRRVLADEGVLVCSTPNRRVFSPSMARPLNPFHVKEFWPDEFRRLLGRHFRSIQFYGQCDVNLADHSVERTHGVRRFIDDNETSSAYIIAVARKKTARRS
ncbi:MAG: class I SAM-dependent methyltransferase [Dehalococcoidia bacterium]|nr:class I SAM-dependent methyltransferase [Dehalococcoidia bacterium]